MTFLPTSAIANSRSQGAMGFFNRPQNAEWISCLQRCGGRTAVVSLIAFSLLVFFFYLLLFRVVASLISAKNNWAKCARGARLDGRVRDRSLLRGRGGEK